jgi:hypothetical protein
MELKVTQAPNQSYCIVRPDTIKPHTSVWYDEARLVDGLSFEKAMEIKYLLERFYRHGRQDAIGEIQKVVLKIQEGKL